MERLLQIASETSPDVLADAADAVGEPAGDVVDAARFYVREILFHKGADAYRVLGLHRDASQEQVKAHYRLLQQWLHPDRRTSDWDAIFAARVNAAWSHLRSEDKRRDYDLAHPAEASDQAASASPAVAWLRQPDYEQPQDPRVQWTRRAPLVALVAICGVLGALALLDSNEDPNRWRDEADAAPEASSLGGLALSRPGPDAAVKSPEANAGRVAIPSRRAGRAPSRATPPQHNDIANASSAAATHGGRALPNAGSAIGVRAPDFAPPRAPSSGQAVAGRPVEIQAPAPSPVHAPAKAVADANVPPPPPRQVVAVPVPPSEQVAESAPALAKVDPPKVSSEQALMAQRVGGQLMAYMNGVGTGTPPIWGSLTTQQGAATLRENLRAAGTNGIDAPRWRVGSREASMRADVRYQDGQAGRIAATLEWRDQRWLVTALSMERDL